MSCCGLPARQDASIFIGNLEAGDAMMGGADVLVADGFTGNVMLKVWREPPSFCWGAEKKTMLSSTKNKMAAAMLKGDLANMEASAGPQRDRRDGVPRHLKPVIKAHGSSNARAISMQFCGPRSMWKAA